jgi:Tfp pilus assembly protein PilF
VEAGDGRGMTRPLGLAAAAVVIGAVILSGAIVLAPTVKPVSARGVDGGAGLAGTPEGAEGAEGAAAARAKDALEVADAPGGGPESWSGDGGVAGGTEPDFPVALELADDRAGGAGGDGTEGGRVFDDAGRERARSGDGGAAVAGDAGIGQTARERSGGSSERLPEAAVSPELPGTEVQPAGEPSSFRIRVRGGAAERTAEEYYGAALGAHRAGELDRAVELYRSALELRPEDGQAWNNLGAVYRALGLGDDAMRAFRMAVEVAPSYAPAWSNLGLTLDAAGREAEAIVAFREALRRDPSNTGAKVNLANKYHGLGMAGEAKTLLREVLRDDPSLPEAHYGLARVLEDDGDVDGAVRHYRLFLELGRGRFAELEERVASHVATLGGGR